MEGNSVWERPDCPAGPIKNRTVFLGSLNQLLAVAAAFQVRNVLETIHNGKAPISNARVRYPGGECQYTDAARLTPEWLADFIKRMPVQMGRDIVRFRKALNPVDMATYKEIAIIITMAARWELPVADFESIKERMEVIRDAVLLPSGKSRSSDVRTVQSIEREGFLGAALAPLLVGETGPVRAYDAGEQVKVETENGWVSWGGVSHMADEDTEIFNRGLSSHLYATLIAIERVRRHIENEVPMLLRITIPLRD